MYLYTVNLNNFPATITDITLLASKVNVNTTSNPVNGCAAARLSTV